jgi:multicomponent Na+:H+ antiporter subunit D
MDEATLAQATAAADWVVILPVVAGLMGGALLLMLRSARVYHAGIAMAVVALIAASDFELLRRVMRDGPLSMTMGNWLPPFGISFTADVLGALCAFVAALVTLVIIIFAEIDREDADGRDSFHALVLVLLAGVSGAFLTGDLFNLYVWFEVMLIASFGLLALGGRPVELDATVKYGFLNFLATTFFLIGLGVLYALLGTLNMADVALRSAAANPGVLSAIAALFFLAFGMKAAAFPVNAWLPASYHAPSAAISALLAALLTKVGVYALLRTLIAVMPAAIDVLGVVVTIVGVLTLVIGPLGAIAETNLRRALGFIVIGGIGSVVAGIAVPNALGLAGAVAYIGHAILTIAALYLAAGLIEITTGTTDTRRMGGVYAASSPLSFAFFVLILAAAGVPPFLGFWPKLLLLQGSIAESNWWIAGALLANAFLTLIAGSRLWSHVFWRNGQGGAEEDVANPGLRPLTARQVRLAVAPTVILASAILVAGCYPQPLLDAAHAAAIDLLDPARYIEAVGLRP